MHLPAQPASLSERMECFANIIGDYSHLSDHQNLLLWTILVIGVIGYSLVLWALVYVFVPILIRDKSSQGQVRSPRETD